MKYYNREVDRIMMPSTFRWDPRYALDDREKEIMKYSGSVMWIVNKFDRSDSRVGILDKHDLIQTGFLGLINGYNAIQREETRYETKAYLELRIKTEIKRSINKTATGVNIPESQINKTKAEMLADKLFGFWLHSFRIDDTELFEKTYGNYMRYMHKEDSYDNEGLEQKLSDLMWILNDKERVILRDNFGISIDKKKSMKEIAKDLSMSEIGVKKAKDRALKKLRNHADRDLFEIYL